MNLNDAANEAADRLREAAEIYRATRVEWPDIHPQRTEWPDIPRSRA